MFAFALWDGGATSCSSRAIDSASSRSTSARGDRRLLFASEVRALLARAGPAPARSDRAVDQFLAYQTVPAPRTLVAGVRDARAGLDAERQRFGPVTRARPYWDLLPIRRERRGRVDRGRSRARSPTSCCASRRRLHLVSDVPVGVFLSGGIDSSALVALDARGRARRRARSRSRFRARRTTRRRSRATVARRFGTEHTRDSARAKRICSTSCRTRSQAIDHPSGDGINTFVVSRAVRAAGIKVALSGLGGDELFGGYPSFARLRDDCRSCAPRLAALARAMRRAAAAGRASASAARRSPRRRAAAAARKRRHRSPRRIR